MDAYLEEIKILERENEELREQINKMKNTCWKTFAEEKPDEKKWILVKIAYSDAELKEMELNEDFQKQDYYSGYVIDGVFCGGCYDMSFKQSVSDFTNEEWRYVE